MVELAMCAVGAERMLGARTVRPERPACGVSVLRGARLAALRAS